MAKKEDPIARDFERICVAWDDLQENRRRDAIYIFLARVFYAVKRYRARKRLNRLIRHAQAATGRSEANSGDPYADLIRAASDGALDRRAVSKYSRALRHARRHKSKHQTLKAFISSCGGLNACADLYAARK